MNEIRNEVLIDLLGIKGMTAKILNAVITHPYIAIVDRGAELPSPGEEMFARLNYQVKLMSPIRGSVVEAYRLAQQDMGEAGWLKEVKE